ncbi:MAG: GtrA family protein [Lachnospiraceae bacterium]
MRDFIKRMWKKFVNRETILYGIFGVGTSILNVVLFKVLLLTNMEYKVANLITIIVVKLAAYLCNKNFVFQSHCSNFLELLKEFGRFVVARGATALIDYFGVILLVELLDANKVISKIFVTVLVIVINYFVGKKHVFKNIKTDD